MLGELGVNEEQFLDVGILVGFELSPPFPLAVHEQGLKATVEMVKYYKSGQAAVAAFAEHPAVKSVSYQDQYARARAMIKYSLIITSEGTIQPIPLAITAPATHGPSPHHPHHTIATEIPNDLHEIFTNRLPDEIYFYLSRGLVVPQALNWLTSGQIIEHPPLDNGETTEYKRFVKEIITEGATGPRATTLALITSVMHNFWTNKKVQAHYWFDQPGSHAGKNVQQNSGTVVQLVERAPGWTVPYQIIEEELRRQNVRGFNSVIQFYEGKQNLRTVAFKYFFLFCLGPYSIPVISLQQSITPSASGPRLPKNSRHEQETRTQMALLRKRMKWYPM